MADEISIPILGAQEIVELVSEWGLNTSVEEIKKPTSHTVQAIYEQFLWQMLHVRLEDLDVPRNIIMQDMEHPELYTEALKLRMFFHLVYESSYDAAGVERFSIQDVSRPDGLRLRKVISVIRNLLAFKNERADFMNSMTQRLEDAKTREAELDAEEAELRAQYNEMLRQRAAEDAQIPEAKHRNKQIQNLLDQEHKRSEKVGKEGTMVKKEAIAARDRWLVVQAELQAAKHRNDRDQARIVHSPERLKRTIAWLASTVEGEKAELEQNKAKARDYQAKLAQLSIIEQDFRLAEDLLTAIENEQQRLDQVSQEVHTVRTHINNRQIEHRELTTKAEQLERQLANAQEKLERVQRTGEEKREASRQRMDMLKAKHA
ncbi:kinetochore-associated Ndc80 complex subunit nuf2, partial [Tulasnella sp. 403]